MPRHQTIRPVQKHPWFLFVAALVLMAGLWILLVAGIKPQEMIVGAMSVACSLLFLWHIWRMCPPQLEFRLKDVVAIWRLPWYILSGVYEIAVILLKDLIGHRADSFFRVSGFETSERDPQWMARQVLATSYTTVAPNFIILGVDAAQSRMLFHQLERSSVPKMTQALGAKP